jgi:hypothetical protein
MSIDRLFLLFPLKESLLNKTVDVWTVPSITYLLIIRSIGVRTYYSNDSGHGFSQNLQKISRHLHPKIPMGWLESTTIQESNPNLTNPLRSIIQPKPKTVGILGANIFKFEIYWDQSNSRFRSLRIIENRIRLHNHTLTISTFGF